MANNCIGLSGQPISIGSSGADNYSINDLKNESNNATAAPNQANSSIRDLHDWFWNNAHITNSNATAADQSDVRFSEFYKTQILEVDYHAYDESGDGWYGHTNNAYIWLQVNSDSFVRDSNGHWRCDYASIFAGNPWYSSHDSDNDPTNNGDIWTTFVGGGLGDDGKGQETSGTVTIGTLWQGDVTGHPSNYHQSHYNYNNVYIRDGNTGAWMMRVLQVDESSSAWNSSSNRHTNLYNYQATDSENPGFYALGDSTAYKGVSGGTLNPPGWNLGTKPGLT